jgi:hypothetical protein
MTADKALFHRLGTVLEIISTLEKKNPAGRTWRYNKSRVKWDDNAEIAVIELTEEYQPEQRVAVIYRGQNQICDINLATCRQSPIGDRVEGIAALVMFISVPLCFVLIGIPIYWGVRFYAKVSTDALRKRVAAYVDELMAKLNLRRAEPTPLPAAS